MLGGGDEFAELATSVLRSKRLLAISKDVVNLIQEGPVQL